MERVTDKMLQAKVDTLNDMTGHARECYSKGEDGRYHPNPGVYHLDRANGRTGLDQMVTDGGTGVHDILPGGTKRELYWQIRALIAGVQIGQGRK